MRSFLICSVLVAVTAVVSFYAGLHHRQTLPAVTTPETMIWHQDCGVDPDLGEKLEKL